MGGDPDAFWRQTPKSYKVFVHAKLRAHDDGLKRIQYQAWVTASLVGFAEVPAFDDVFKPRGKREVNHEQMEAVARTIAASGWGTYTPPPETPPEPSETQTPSEELQHE